MWEVMIVCVIMHNLIVEDERDERNYNQGWDFQDDLTRQVKFQEFLHVYRQMRDQENHIQHQDHLVEHIWIHQRNVSYPV